MSWWNRVAPQYQLYLGGTTPIWCERFNADPQWIQTGNPEWQWAIPSANPASGDPRTARTGSHVLGIDVTQDGRYVFGDATSVETPAIDVSGYAHVRLQYWRWLTVEDAKFDNATITANGTPVWTNVSSAAGDLDHIDKEWRFHDLDLTDNAAGGSITLAWTLASDQSGQFGGWSLDDVCLVGIGKIAACGDATLDEGETCDDGDLVDGDGCSATCMTELPDEAGCCSTEPDPSGPLLLGLGVIATIARRRRPW